MLIKEWFEVFGVKNSSELAEYIKNNSKEDIVIDFVNDLKRKGLSLKDLALEKDFENFTNLDELNLCLSKLRTGLEIKEM